MASHLWLIYALGASVFWGLGYALTEKVLKAGVHPTVFFLITRALILPFSLLLAIYFGQLKSSVEVLVSNNGLLVLTFLCVACLVAGSVLILTSVTEKNATAASMIEIAYPLFTALFAYLLFKDVQVNWWTAVSGLLIFSGIGVMYVKG